MKSTPHTTFSYLVLLLVFASTQELNGQLNLTAESGLAINGYNDVAYPNSSSNRGSRFSLTEDFDAKQPTPYIRIELNWQFLDRNILELTAAPLSFDYDKSSDRMIDFGDNTYNQNVSGTYQFNTYRLSYRYLFVDQEKWQLAAGATVLIRDARIALQDGTSSDETTDLGVVPLLSFDVNYAFTEKLSALLKGDALVGPQGRAEDVLIGARYELISNQLRLRGGYRIIEGGADVSQVYNFSLIHFAAIGFNYQF